MSESIATEPAAPMPEAGTYAAIDHAHMAQALRLAAQGSWTTKPNPMVGCVLAHGERIVGQGWHRRAGEAHAEVHALAEAGASARGATAYVTLEPCGRHGRTPPCVDALIAAGIRRVVMASEDAHQGEGNGVSRLRAAGIEVQAGLMRESARELNRGFFARIEGGRPWLRIKLGMSLDARTALSDGRSQWITAAAARADVMRWRARSSAVLTGSGTVQMDDPRLTVRLQTDDAGDYEPPLRVVLDSRLSAPAGCHVLDGSAPTLWLHTELEEVPARFAQVERQAVPAHEGRVDLHAALAELARRGCNEVQVEAGARLAGAFIAEGLCDELLLYIAPRLLGDDARPLLGLPPLPSLAAATQWRWHDVRSIGPDLRLLLRPDLNANVGAR